MNANASATKWRWLLPIVLAALGVLGLTAITSQAANTIDWQLASTGLPTSNIVRDVAFGDVNNDGKPDFIGVGNVGVVVYGGDGAGVWSSGSLTTGLPTSGGYGHVAVGDLNNDGNTDIVASAGNGVGVRSWFGDGAGSWTVITTGLPTGTSEGVALGDVNKDGRLDIIVAGGAPVFQGVHVYLNQGSSFSETTALTTTGTFNDIAAAYVDHDGYVDVIAAANSTGLKFWRGNANNAWIVASNGLTTSNNWRGVTFGDIDLDGKPELVAARSNIAGANGGGIYVYEYDIQSNLWSLGPNQLPVNNSYYKLILDDLNTDGRLDLVAGGGSTFLSPGVFAWLGSINGFVATTSPTTTGSWERPAVGDFDRDGLLDIGAGAYNSGGAAAWRSNGVRDPVGSWTLIASPQITASPRALAHADFNLDGDLDVIFTREGGGMNMYVGDGGNAWTYCPAFNMAGAAYTGTYENAIAGLWDRNSRYPQIIGARSDGGGIQYFGNVTNNCGYFFTYQVTTTGSYRGLSAADIDDDSNIELVAAPTLINTGLRLWEFNGGAWTARPNPVSTGTYCDTALDDLDHDGSHDIAAADCGGGGVRAIMLGGRTIVTYTLIATGEFHTVAIGDLNNDGHNDVVAAKNGASSQEGIYVWTNDGTAANWNAWPSPAPTGQYFDLDLGDVNHDGWLDILAARDGLGVSVWLGDGAGGWTSSSTNLPTSGAYFNSLFGHVDHDGNLDILSTGLNQGVKIWTAAEAAPPTINNFQPTSSDWISTTQSPNVTASVIDAISGISTTSGLYRYSTNGGGTWSNFFPAAISGSNGSTSTQSISAVSVPFNQDSGTQNLIEFRASDLVGNIGVAQSLIKIDTTPPTAPASLTSSDHSVSTWSNDDTISVSWSGATDATSGVYGYSVLFDQNPTTLPPAIVNAGGTSFNSAALGDGNNWYAHVRTRDVAGNWSTTARHAGPFYIDTTPPTNPTTFGGSHTPGVWDNDPTVFVTWSGATDPGGSGVYGYSYQWDVSPAGVPDQNLDTTGNSDTSGVLATSNNHWFHVRTRDLAGNWSGSAAHRGAFYIDTTPPTSSASSPTSSGSTSFTVSWSGSDAHSGIDNYDVQSRNKTTNGAWTTWKSATSTTSGSFSGTSGHIYEFRSRARDNAGNLEAYPGSADDTTEIATLDFFVRNPGIEVNQAVQDLNNSVLLIARKRTFVRCYVQSDSGNIASVNARLRVYRGATYWGILSPANSGATITVRSSPDRAQLDHAYYFDVPTGWLSAGSVRFECEVNMPKKYGENDYTNNVRSVTVSFVEAPDMDVWWIDIPYNYGGSTRHVRSADRTRLTKWTKAAYPINQLNVTYAYLDPPYGSLPTAADVNDDLWWNKIKKFLDGDFSPLYARWYAQALQVDDDTFMRGRSMGLPEAVASGPTGDTGGWDPDGNYGDWYGGHENGHSYGRAHVQGAPNDPNDSGGCGDEAGPDGNYPYAQGRMSPQTTMWTNSTLYGFDWSLTTPMIVPPNWYDMMTYCAGQWISDYTYEAIYNQMVSEEGTLRPTIAQGVERLVVIGKIVTATNTVTLSTFYRVPNADDWAGRDISGTYHIKLLDVSNAVLADYNFSPRGVAEVDDPEQDINEMVPWITGTQQIVIASATQHLITRTVSANAPAVSVQAPAGGITLTGSSVSVSWIATDIDGDPLTFSLDYSNDGGATWLPLSGQIPSTTIEIGLDLLPGGAQGKFRVWVSDGVNTAYDETDGTFVVPQKAPQILAVEPISGSSYVISQTISFAAEAYDPEDGTLPDGNLQWASDLDGVLGTGALLQLDTLSIGTHLITLTVTDSANAQATQTFTVIVTAEPDTPISSEIYLPLITKN
jgi:hypothetical protein